MTAHHDFAKAPLQRGPLRPFNNHTEAITDIVVHYSWTLLSEPWDAARIHREHTARGWNGIGYHFVVLPDGRVEFGRPVHVQGAHVRNANNRKIGICWIGGRIPGDNQNGYNTMTPAQERSLRQLIAQLRQDYPEAKVNGHRDHVATQCPAFDVASWWAGAMVSPKRAEGPAVVNPPLGTAGLDTHRPVLRHGDRGAFVVDAQDRLVDLGYALGRVDGIFGNRTREAVMAFQVEHDLTPSGVVDASTWAALVTEDQPRPERDVTLEDLRGDASRTIVEADKSQAGAAALTGLGTAPLVLAQLDEVAARIEQSGSTLEKVQHVVMAYWPVGVALAVGVAVILALNHIKQARVDDARKGRNIGR